MLVVVVDVVVAVACGSGGCMWYIAWLLHACDGCGCMTLW